MAAVLPSGMRLAARREGFRARSPWSSASLQPVCMGPQPQCSHRCWRAAADKTSQAEVEPAQGPGTTPRPSSGEPGGSPQQSSAQQSTAPPASPASPQTPPSASSPTTDSATEVDRQLSAMWEDLKRDMRKEVDPEAARLLDSISYEELTSANAMQFFRRLADAQLGPILSAMGLNVDPFDFFVEVIKLATFIQFTTVGMVWYGSQGLAHLPPGQVAIATAGIALGYLTRPAFKVEQLLFPAYNSLLQLFLPSATFVVTPSSMEQVQGTLNQLGICLAVAFLLPRAAFGWDVSDSTALVVPLTMGWFLFDLTYLAGLLLQLRRTDGDE